MILEDDIAYISWYGDGVLMLDISDPYHPYEIARFAGTGPEFEAQNGGVQAPGVPFLRQHWKAD